MQLGNNTLIFCHQHEEHLGLKGSLRDRGQHVEKPWSRQPASQHGPEGMDGG